MIDAYDNNKPLFILLTARYFSFLLILFSIVLFFKVQISEGQESCQNAYEKMSRYYKKYLLGTIYFQYSAYTVLNGRPGEKVVSEIWGDGNRVKLANQFVVVYQDGENQVVILKDRRLILIRDVKNGEAIRLKGSDHKLFEDFETTLKNSANVVCIGKGNGGNLTITYNDALARKYLIRKISIDYDDKTEQIVQTKYAYLLPGGGEKEEIYNYLKHSDKFDPGVLKDSALDQIYEDGHVKKEYMIFTIKDLRGKTSRTN